MFSISEKRNFKMNVSVTKTESNSSGKNMHHDPGYLNLMPNCPQSVESGRSKMNLIDTSSDFSKFTDLNNGMVNGGIATTSLKNVPAGIQTNAMNGFQSNGPHLLSPGMPGIPGIPSPHIMFPNGMTRLPAHINNGLVHNTTTGYISSSGISPTTCGPHLSPAGFPKLPNDVIFDPLTQTPPVFWNSIPSTPFYMPPKEEDVMLSLPRDIHPPHFLNVYPITAVPTPTLTALSPITFRPKRIISEDPNKNRKYAVSFLVFI